jgi:hypothetical protein
MTVKEFYDYITKHMTAEQALMKMLEGQVMEYEKLKFSQDENAIHPVILIAMAAMDMGWTLAIPDPNDTDEVIGLVVGTHEYVDDMLTGNGYKLKGKSHKRTDEQNEKS